MTRIRASRLPIAAGILVLSSLSAQAPVVATDQVIGWTTPGTTLGSPGTLDMQDVLGNCKPAKVLCKNVLGRPAQGVAGGTAYDPRHQSTWNSDGNVIVEYGIRPNSAGSCKALCKLVAAKVSSTGIVTGLAMADGLRFTDGQQRLFHLEMPSAGGSFAIREYVFSSAAGAPCFPKAGNFCRFIIPAKALALGLAYDEIRDVLYVSVSIPNSTGTGYGSIVYPTKRPVPGATCKVLCKFPIMKQCSTRPVTGLGYDACGRLLYATDGLVTQVVQVQNALGSVLPCTPKVVVACCKKQIGARYRSLAVVPGWKVAKKGLSCSSGVCPSCPNMVAKTVGGDPSLGNPDFGFSLSGAPSPAFAFPLFSVSPCGTGWNSPPFCKPLLTNPMGTIIGPAIPMTGAPGCNGSASFTPGIPVSPALCKQTICAQWLVLCFKFPPLSFGFGVSHAIQFTIAGS